MRDSERISREGTEVTGRGRESARLHKPVSPVNVEMLAAQHGSKDVDFIDERFKSELVGNIHRSLYIWGGSVRNKEGNQ